MPQIVLQNVIQSADALPISHLTLCRLPKNVSFNSKMYLTEVIRVAHYVVLVISYSVILSSDCLQPTDKPLLNKKY